MKFILIACVILFKDLSISTKAGVELRQVVILSRHGLRTPEHTPIKITPRKWPTWKDKPGDLTEKGFILEGHIASFVTAWLRKLNILTEDCPTRDSVEVYADNISRAIKSAESFVKSGFPGCNVTVLSGDNNATDPNFSHVIRNSSIAFKELVLSHMQHVARSLKLNASYQLLENTLKYNESELCTVERKCDLNSDINTFSVETGEKPKVKGPLKISDSAVDSFIMQYYEGFPLKDVAWGQLKNTKQWKQVSVFKTAYHNVTLNLTTLAIDMGRPIIKYIHNVFTRKQNLKFTLLMGHATNIYNVLFALQFKEFVLPRQYEITPISGKIVFQKWCYNKTDKCFLKMNYFYQSRRQIRKSLPLNLARPALDVELHLEKCTLDEIGNCDWEDFIRILYSL